MQAAKKRSQWRPAGRCGPGKSWAAPFARKSRHNLTKRIGGNQLRSAGFLDCGGGYRKKLDRRPLPRPHASAGAQAGEKTSAYKWCFFAAFVTRAKTAGTPSP